MSPLARRSIAIQPVPRRVALLTDFGGGPYVGQVLLRLAAMGKGAAVVALASDLPQFRADLAACLLPGLLSGMPARTVFVCVVDPGVGGGRDILAARVGQDWLLAPDNGLLVPLLKRAVNPSVWRVDWRPRRMSASFHGRDVFAPLAAALLAGRLPMTRTARVGDLVGADWPDERAAICYQDDYGNLMTGLWACGYPDSASLVIAGRKLRYARTFCEARPGEPFWYRNAFGLVEVALANGSAAALLGVGPGEPLVMG